MLSIAKRPFKSDGVFYAAGSVITDPAKIRLYNTKVREGKILLVDEHDMDSVVEYFLIKAGVDITPTIDALLTEQKRLEAERVAEEERLETERLAEEERLETERLAEETRLKEEQLAEEARLAAEKAATTTKAPAAPKAPTPKPTVSG